MATPKALLSGRGEASGHLLKWSTNVTTYLLYSWQRPNQVCINLHLEIPWSTNTNTITLVKTARLAPNFWLNRNGTKLCVWLDKIGFILWHCGHIFTYSQISSTMFLQIFSRSFRMEGVCQEWGEKEEDPQLMPWRSSWGSLWEG